MTARLNVTLSAISQDRFSAFLAPIEAAPNKLADSFYAFSVHKNGSTLMFDMIGAVSRMVGFPAASIPDFIFNEGILFKDWRNKRELAVYFRKPWLYYGFRELPELMFDESLELRQRKFVFLARDPRDALVSEYFSFGRRQGSHALPQNNPEAVMKIIRSQDELSIDDYVLGRAKVYRDKLLTYRSALDFERGLILRYEDAYFDKRKLLIDTFEHFGIAVPADVISEVAARFDVRPEQEDDTRHIRQGLPGDHVRKLAPATIVRLNDELRDTAAFFGYRL